ncbi:hypothetical protein ACTWQF_09815 [Streptomyces sp. 8N114]|uniref:hypothetical protein n=1 Tax=Streptomyces sp. 8N114 TaxID=3457419 RepID=UPI003FD5E819
MKYALRRALAGVATLAAVAGMVLEPAPAYAVNAYKILSARAVNSGEVAVDLMYRCDKPALLHITIRKKNEPAVGDVLQGECDDKYHYPTITPDFRSGGETCIVAPGEQCFQYFEKGDKVAVVLELVDENWSTAAYLTLE